MVKVKLGYVGRDPFLKSPNVFSGDWCDKCTDWFQERLPTYPGTHPSRYHEHTTTDWRVRCLRVTTFDPVTDRRMNYHQKRETVGVHPRHSLDFHFSRERVMVRGLICFSYIPKNTSLINFRVSELCNSLLTVTLKHLILSDKMCFTLSIKF